MRANHAPASAGHDNICGAAYFAGDHAGRSRPMPSEPMMGKLPGMRLREVKTQERRTDAPPERVMS